MGVARAPSGTVCLAGCGSAARAPECAEPAATATQSQSRYRSQGRTAAHTVREESESIPESGPHCRTHSQGGVRVDTGVRAALPHTQSGRSQSRYRSQGRTAAHRVTVKGVMCGLEGQSEVTWDVENVVTKQTCETERRTR